MKTPQPTPEMAGTLQPSGEVLISVESGPMKLWPIRSWWPSRKEREALALMDYEDQDAELYRWWNLAAPPVTYRLSGVLFKALFAWGFEAEVPEGRMTPAGLVWVGKLSGSQVAEVVKFCDTFNDYGALAGAARRTLKALRKQGAIN